MIDDVWIGAHEVRDASGRGFVALEMVMAVEQDYEVSKQAALTALWIRK